ncbi:MAG: threonine synthase [Rickettsiales bacterium]|nr:threonine synthase [Rickettsiales bacterium]
MPIIYQSTRGQSPELSFKEVVLAGLAPDGGLYVPKTLPHFSKEKIASWKGLDYPSLAAEILAPFCDDIDIKRLTQAAYSTFRHEETAPLTKLAEGHYLLELFHGPTLAFKDFALQLLGHLFDELLAEKGEHATILGATSGDTGSAAIAGCRGRKNMDIYILHPKGRVSDVQRRQMTTVLDSNVHNIAVEGSFDDCQRIVKELFTDAEFRQKQRLTAVNSINWARIMAQIVYYFYASLKLGGPEQAVSFSVPTGNFGDIYAGYLAKRMGLPVDTLMIASNRNDILTRCFETGEYKVDGATPSLSPSMDIQISSNFERLLFEYVDADAEALRQMMADLKETGSFTLPQAAHQRLQANFKAARVDDAQTLAEIQEIYEKTGEILDPHSAVGTKSAVKVQKPGIPMVTLATAHPAKFPDAVKEAIALTPDLPPHMADLYEKEERMVILSAKSHEIKHFIENSA